MTTTMDLRFREPEVRRLSGATERQVEYWRRQGWIVPEGEPGSGNVLLWSFDDVLRLTILATMCPSGQRRDGNPKRYGPLITDAELAGEYLVLEPEIRHCSENEVLATVAAHPFVTVVPLERLRQGLLDRLAG